MIYTYYQIKSSDSNPIDFDLRMDQIFGSTLVCHKYPESEQNFCISLDLN